MRRTLEGLVCRVSRGAERVRIQIQRPEYEAAIDDEKTVCGFRPALYKQLRDAGRQILDGEHDVFGDGRTEGSHRRVGRCMMTPPPILAQPIKPRRWYFSLHFVAY